MKNTVKKMVAVVAVVMFLSTPVFAGTDKDTGTVCQGSSCTTDTGTGNVAYGGAGGSATSSSNATGIGVGVGIGQGGNADVTNNNSNKNVNKNTNKNSNKNVNKNTNKQAQQQGQAQGQKQSVKNKNEQSQNNSQVIAPSQTIITEAPLVSGPAVTPQDVPMLQGGKFGDVTAAMPEFFGLKPLAKGEKVTKVLKVLNGGWFTKIRLEDVPGALLEGVPAGTNVRYSIWVKEGASSVTTGGGIAGTLAGAQGAGTGALLPGWASSNADPVFVVFVWLVK